jgi:hypothetical protein
VSVFALSGGLGGLALLVGLFVGLLMIVLGVVIVARQRPAVHQGPGPFGSRWPTSSWAYAMFVLVFIAGAASGTLARHPARYGAVFWGGTIAFLLYRYLSSRAQTRPCPRCGGRVPVGMLDCDACGFDFRSIGQPHRAGHDAAEPRP